MSNLDLILNKNAEDLSGEELQLIKDELYAKALRDANMKSIGRIYSMTLEELRGELSEIQHNLMEMTKKMKRDGYEFVGLTLEKPE